MTMPHPMPTPETTATAEPRSMTEYTDKQRFFLHRLNRLLDLSRRVHTGPAKDWERELVKKAIFSTFNDCIAQNLETEALDAMQARDQATIAASQS